MGILKPAANQTAYLKAGFMGFQGSGKTYTASRLLAETLLHAKIKNPKVAIVDTEKSSDFLVDYYKEKGIELLVVKTRAFKQLIEAIKEAESAGVHGFMVDSVTHIWRELMKSYKKRFKIKGQFPIWAWDPIKEEWGQFTELFINSPMHFCSLGRAGFDWGEEEDDQGNKKLVKQGTKMKAEGEFGYESDLLIEMERVRDQKKNADVHRAWVLKDRWDILDGKHFDDPTFKCFLPVIGKLNLGGNHYGVDTDSDSQDLFDDPDNSLYQRKKEREIALEELQATLVKLDLSGRSDKAQKERIAALEQVFGTSSKRAIEEMWAPQIKEGIDRLYGLFDKSEPKEAAADVAF